MTVFNESLDFFKAHFLLPSYFRTIYTFLADPVLNFLCQRTSALYKQTYITEVRVLLRRFLTIRLPYIPYFGMRFYTNAFLQINYNPRKNTKKTYYYAAIAGALNTILLLPYTYAI